MDSRRIYIWKCTGLEIAKKSNIETYGNESGMTLEQAMEKYGSYKNIIKK